MKVLDLGGAGTVPATITGNKNFTGNVDIDGTLNVDGVVTFVTMVTGSGNIMAGAAFALGFTGRGQFKSSVDGRVELYAADGSTFGILRVGTGTAAVNALSMRGDVRTGFFSPAAGVIGVAPFGVEYTRFHESGAVGALQQAATNLIIWTDGAVSGTQDTKLRRVSAGIVGTRGGSDGVDGAAGFQPAQSANGATIQILGISEQVTLNTGAAFTDTTANLLVAGSINLAACARITTTITTSVNWKLGDATITDRFTSANSTMTANTTDAGGNQWLADRVTAGQGAWQAAAAKLRITLNANPGAGVVRVTNFYLLVTAPTS